MYGKYKPLIQKDNDSIMPGHNLVADALATQGTEYIRVYWTSASLAANISRVS